MLPFIIVICSKKVDFSVISIQTYEKIEAIICFNKNAIKTSFNGICSVVVIFMIGYWAYKYEIDDRDIGVVDYISLQDSPHIKFPVLTICFINPIIDHRLKAVTDNNISVEEYNKMFKVYQQSVQQTNSMRELR